MQKVEFMNKKVNVLHALVLHVLHALSIQTLKKFEL